MKKKITVISLSFIGAAILWFICLVASQLFFGSEVFSKGISSFVWRFLIILLIVGFSGLLLLTSVSIYAENKPLSYISAALVLVTALLALIFFIAGKFEKGFLSYATLDFVIVSLYVNLVTDMQYRAKRSLSGLKAAGGITGGIIAVVLLLSVHSLAGKLWGSTAFVFFFIVLCVAFVGFKIAVGAIAKSAGGKKRADNAQESPQESGNGDTVTISRAEYEALLKIKRKYEKLKK